MSKFVILTDIDDQEVWVNLEHVFRMYPREDHTEIHFLNEKSVGVKQSTLQIAEWAGIKIPQMKG